MSRWKITGLVIAICLLLLIAAMFYSCQSGSYPRAQKSSVDTEQTAPPSKHARRTWNV